MSSIRRLLHTINQRKSSIYRISPQASKREYTNNVVTIPNVLTFSRLASAPVMGYFICNGMQSPAIACFAYAAMTDLFDGWLARKLKQQSDVGAIMDPVADKLLITTCFIAMYNVSMVPLWLVKIIVVRDVLLLGMGASIRYFGFNENKKNFRNFLDIKNYPTIGFEPTTLSKWNTALQCLLVTTHLTTSQFSGDFVYDWAMFGFHIIVANTTLFSGIGYLQRFLLTGWETRPPKLKQ